MKSSRKHFFSFQGHHTKFCSLVGVTKAAYQVYNRSWQMMYIILSHGAGFEGMMGLWRARVSLKKVQGRPLVKVKPQFQWKWQDQRGDREKLRPSTQGGQDNTSWGYSLSCHGDSSISEMSRLWHEHLGSIDCRVEVTWAHEASCMTCREQTQESEATQMQ